MCGITGWVDYDRDLTAGEARAALAAMTATMACRGPDAEGDWVSRHAALGHRRLAVIDLPGGRQPMTVVESGRTLAALTFSGEIYNYRELRRELESLGHTFRTSGDTEVVLRAYLAWGDLFPTRLNGMYALAVWNPDAQELLLVRDRCGIKPLYYARTDQGVLFGSEPKALLAHPAIEPRVTVDGFRELLGLVKTPGHAVYDGMREVRPGHLIKVTKRGATEERYWALRAKEHTDGLDDTISTVRSLLEQAVTAQLAADVPLCSLLSGGLDSSAITALAARQRRHSKLRSFAIDFAHQERDFAADPVHLDADRPYARALAAHAGTDHTDVTLITSGMTDRRIRREALRARDLPAGLGDFDVSAALLFKAVREHSTVALSGEGADELFGGYFWCHDPQAVAADTFPWHAAIDLYTKGGFGDAPMSTRLLDPGLVAELDLPRYRDDRYRDALAEVPRTEPADRHERRMREITYLHLTRFLPMLLDRKDRMSMATGLEVRVPFCDHRLAQYVFNIPWAMQTFDGREKSVLRAAVRDLLPEVVLNRPKNPYPTVQDPEYGSALRAGLTEIAHDPAAPVRDLLDPAAVGQALSADTDPKDVRYATELVLDLNTWLSDYRVRTAL
ncbi:asparagine synthase (glutamine-hydrolyzing) [Streptomyces qinzhouensis]|uniref:asparagine synthase (glutamine-hydrolyzing) n=1 Tax=Streptomyces qinzhouensis TaxID=2599401 RepID=A0A5B8JE55_9ACTN|nr:asparagine synthase (glutamine-hydrolyzing) [Streptomyces qinzhouensis]QDY80035.1 asparagine synthase (glutamine-hydrolyzing) [Streptomyces qinzhouensis]